MPQSYRNTFSPTATSPRKRVAQGLIVLGVVATAGIALAGPAKLMRELRSRMSESDRGTVAQVGRVQALRRTPVANRSRSAAGSTAAQASEIPMNLTYVDTSRTAYTRFRTWVNNAVAGNPGYAYEARDSALMFRITRDVKYCTHAIGMVEQQVSQAETAIAAGQNPVVAGDSYLDVGPMIGDVAMTYDTCNTQLTANQRQRWAAYAEQAIWNVWNYQSARWGTRSAPWSGWSIDNPGNNYHYSFLEATMSWALASRSATWMSFLQSNKLPKLEAYYRTIATGGSQEGTGYGTAQMRLFNLYSMWRDATGIDLANANTHATNTIKWWTHATVPTLDRFAPLATSRASPCLRSTTTTADWCWKPATSPRTLLRSGSPAGGSTTSPCSRWDRD